jgi:hypothetical protein
LNESPRGKKKKKKKKCVSKLDIWWRRSGRE